MRLCACACVFVHVLLARRGSVCAYACVRACVRAFQMDESIWVSSGEAFVREADKCPERPEAIGQAQNKLRRAMQQRAIARSALLKQRASVSDELWRLAADDSDKMWVPLPHEQESAFVDATRCRRWSAMSQEEALNMTLRASASLALAPREYHGWFSELLRIAEDRISRHMTIDPLSPMWCAWSVLISLVANVGLFFLLYQISFQPWNRLWNQIFSATIEALWIVDILMQVHRDHRGRLDRLHMSGTFVQMAAGEVTSTGMVIITNIRASLTR